MPDETVRRATLTANELAQALGIRPQQVYRGVQAGIFRPPLVVRVGRLLRFSARELDRFLAEGGRGLEG